MKKITLPLFIWLFITLVSCGPKKSEMELYFEASFPKKNKNLSLILGEKLSLKTSEGDTIHISITSTDDSNLIIDTKTLDTLFLGKVSKSKGLYYFSEEYAPGKFRISAAKIHKDKIYGLFASWFQEYLVSENIEKEEFKKLVKEKNEKAIVLKPVKSQMKKLYSSILDSIPPFTIIQLNNQEEISLDERKDFVDSTATTQKQIFNFTAYPNPATTYLHLEFDDEGDFDYNVFDLKGSCHLKGHLSTEEYRLDLSQINQGNYILALTDNSTNQTSQIRIIKN